MKKLFQGEESLELGSWGNPVAVASLWFFAPLRYQPVPRASWHPWHKVATWNHPEWPIVTWFLGLAPVNPQ